MSTDLALAFGRACHRMARLVVLQRQLPAQLREAEDHMRTLAQQLGIRLDDVRKDAQAHVAVLEADAGLTDSGLPDDGGRLPNAKRELSAGSRQGYASGPLDEVVPFYLSSRPMTLDQLQRATGRSKSRLQDWLNRHSSTLVAATGRGVRGDPLVWSLIPGVQP
jgi:hypothetical protein